MQLDYDALAALAAILRTGSFDGAAAELGLTQPAISLRIKTLEDRVGAILIRRGRPCTATPTGARLNRHAEEVGLLEKTLTADLGGLLPDRDRPLRLAINADSLATWVLPALAEVEESVDTLGGLAFVLAEEVPQPGTELIHPSGWKIEVTAGDETHVTRLRLHRPSQQEFQDDG